MTDTITRRMALAGAAALPLAPAAAVAERATANATDAAWAAYVSANTAVVELDAEFHAGIDHDDDVLDAVCYPWRAAGKTVLEAPVATLTDVERKLAVLYRLAEDSITDSGEYARLLAQVRAATGRAA